MTPAVASIRQNLQMLLDHGDLNPAGSSIGLAAYIHRSDSAPPASRSTSADPLQGGPCVLGGGMGGRGRDVGLRGPSFL